MLIVEQRPVTGQLADMPSRGLPTRGLDDSLADWSTRGLVNSRTGQLAVSQIPPKERKLSGQSRSWHQRVGVRINHVPATPAHPVGLKSDGTTGHLEVDTPRAAVPSLSTCDGHTTGHWPWHSSSDGTDTFNCPSLCGSSSRF